LREIVIVHEYLPFAVHFAELHIRLDQPRFRLVIAQAGLRIEPLDHVHGTLYKLNRTI
jgi:hypothetical protein